MLELMRNTACWRLRLSSLSLRPALLLSGLLRRILQPLSHRLFLRRHRQVAPEHGHRGLDPTRVTTKRRIRNPRRCRAQPLASRAPLRRHPIRWACFLADEKAASVHSR